MSHHKAPCSSRSSSPSVNTPRPQRSRSSSLSSAANDEPPFVSRAGSYDDDFSDDVDHAPTKKGAKGRGKRSAAAMEDEVFDPKALTPAQCNWGSCSEQFWELEPMIEHLHTVHAFPSNPQDAGTKKPLIWACDWAGCPRRGKNQNTKFALLGHLKSHTGEKPFNCPRPECDKSFTRTDALQKHMRVQHGETILPTRRPPSKKSKKAAARGGSDSDGGGDDDSVMGGDDEEEGAGEQWTEEELRLFDLHPEKSKGFLAYVVLRAKWTAAIGEAEGLASEAEVLGLREAELKGQCDELLKRIMRKECVAPHAANDRAQLEKYLTDYAHQPLKTPLGWTGEPK